MDLLTGYQHPDYARSLSEFGTPRQLPACGGWILERPIPGGEGRTTEGEKVGTEEGREVGTAEPRSGVLPSYLPTLLPSSSGLCDAMGPYPLFMCLRWDQLPADLAAPGSRWVTLVLVTDPFAELDPAHLATGFDFVKPFKCHFVADLTTPFAEALNKHHRYYVKKSLKEIETEVCDQPRRYLREWIGLYDNLVQKRGIRGLRAFSAWSFEQQLGIPGMVLILGRQRGEIIGAHLVAIQGDVAYSHLAAFSAVGYQLNAAYAIYWATLEYLTARHVRYLDLGGAPGLDPDAPADGLTLFKRGWSRTTRLVYLCGRVLDPDRYAELCRLKGAEATDYFPAYRAGEFA